jgi:hypothetical protein
MKIWDNGYVDVNLKLVPSSTGGANPNATIVIQAIDLGTFTKNVNGVLFHGYQNSDTLADVGCTNAQIPISVQ